MYVFIFRRDFRLEDNRGFIRCLRDAKKDNRQVLPVFIYNKRQVDPKLNAYFSNNSMQFLVESIKDLEDQLKDRGGYLHKFIVDHEEEEADVFRSMTPKVTHIYANMDLTPFARQRDDKLKARLEGDISFTCIEDYTLFQMGEPKTKTQKGTTYQVFSFLYKKIGSLHKIIPEVESIPSKINGILVQSPVSLHGIKDRFKLEEKREKAFYTPNSLLAVNGGRAEGLKKLGALEKKYKDYEVSRDDMANEEGTTRLSAFLKYGCLSIREVYWTAFKAYGLKNPINRELFFREFYYNIVWNYPRVLKGMVDAKNKKDKKNENEPFIDLGIKWDTGAKATKNFDAWKNGKTGVPLVDAGMRQLNTTGFMHNRARMVTSMFLIKDLFIDWRWGEKYFATRLVDYDPAQNNAGWMWSSSLAPYATPYYRTMNPFTQQKRFDKDAKYVKKWVSELKDVPIDIIEKWENKVKEKEKKERITEYPRPIVEDHTSVVSDVEDKYKKLFEKKKKDDE